jgi:hypothetical protein
MTSVETSLHAAALRLATHLRPRLFELVTVGVGEDWIVVYVAKHSQPVRAAVPETWEGFNVCVRVSGVVRPARTS